MSHIYFYFLISLGGGSKNLAVIYVKDCSSYIVLWEEILMHICGIKQQQQQQKEQENENKINSSNLGIYHFVFPLELILWLYLYSLINAVIISKKIFKKKKITQISYTNTAILILIHTYMYICISIINA